ncbi:hypothetical protein HA466_0275550 [Hirschfeldia incana]|nr:hypothetical protein HA466_0275550 [Hirschfeldia incana]
MIVLTLLVFWICCIFNFKGHVVFHNEFLRHHLFCIFQILAGSVSRLHLSPGTSRKPDAPFERGVLQSRCSSKERVVKERTMVLGKWKRRGAP